MSSASRSLLPGLARTLRPKNAAAAACRPCPVARAAGRRASTTTTTSSGPSGRPAAAAAAAAATAGSSSSSSSSATHHLPAERGGHIPSTSNPTEFEAIAEARRRGAVQGRGHPRRLPTAPSPTELPNPHSYLKAVLATVTLGALSWAGFLAYVTNGEKASSSVFRQVMFVLRTSELVERTLGESVVLEKTWWTGGEPWVSGSISVLKGRADLSFRLRGSRNSGRIYFTSIRPSASSAFHVLRFKLILDDPARGGGGLEKGDEVDLRQEMLGKGYDLEQDDVPLIIGQLLSGGGSLPSSGTSASSSALASSATSAVVPAPPAPTAAAAAAAGQTAGGVGSAGGQTTGLELGALKLV